MKQYFEPLKNFVYLKIMIYPFLNNRSSDCIFNKNFIWHLKFFLNFVQISICHDFYTNARIFFKWIKYDL